MILIVDDEKDIADFISRVLSKGNLESIEAQDGGTALAMLHDKKPQAIILDLMMPGMSGFDVLKKIKADPTLAGIPVIICSTLGDREYKEQAQALGAKDYITKPFRASELISTVQSAIAK